MKILLVDDEEQVLKGVSRIISCEEDDWEVETAISGQEALDVLENEAFDAVVSDMRMPGMDGAQLLDEVGRKYPGMLRIVLSGQADRETVLRAVKPMHQYLSKPCDPEQLIDVIRRAEIFQETISSSDVLNAIGQANCLPSFPDIVNDINHEYESESGDAKSIASIVVKDPLLSARILQLANSSIFALPAPVADIDRAVSLVGGAMIRSLAMMQVVYSEIQNHDHILSAKRLLDHGLVVAVMSKKLAKWNRYTNEESNLAFSAGLLHDVGKLILLNAFPEKYEQVIKRSRSEGRSIDDLEMEQFGASHQGIGAYLFGLWGLPAEVIESVASHHSFAACAAAAGRPRQIVFAANWIARNHSVDELNAQAEACKDQATACQFAEQLREWQQYIEQTEEPEYGECSVE